MKPELFDKLPFYIVIKCLEFTGKFAYRSGVLMNKFEKNDDRYNKLSKIPRPLKIKRDSYSILLHDTSYKHNCTLTYNNEVYEGNYKLNIIYSKYSNDYNINYVYQLYYVYNNATNVWEKNLRPVTHHYE